MYSNGEGAITDDREAYIWFPVAKAKGNESTAKGLDVMNDLLTTSEIKSARLEAARRLETIEQGETDSAE